MSKRSAFNAECSSCNATGVYRGFCEGPGTAVECLHCGGTGMEVISFVPFSHRRRRRGIKWVSKSRGTLIASGVGAVGERERYATWFARTAKAKK